jgi:cytosol alanyl aminopeptidase
VPSPEEPPLVRLPSDVRPTRYSLTLEISPERERFSGNVKIELELERARDVIWMHGSDLTVKAASAVAQGSFVNVKWEQVHPNGVAALRFDRPVGPGPVTVSIGYDAAFGDGVMGLYRAEKGGARYAFTHFEPVRARQAFPCLDEPIFKTPFDVTLVVPKDAKAVANSSELRREDTSDGRSRVTFATTAPLPTYLLAWAVGPLDVVTSPPIPPNAIRKRPLNLRGVAAQGRGPELTYALARTAEMVGALEDYFGLEYPYDKLDIIAVPQRNGAMENAGAITFREILLLIDDKTASLAQRRYMLVVLAHELAHMWLGDLVTMPWWDDLWLKEAAATWMSDLIVRKLYPEHAFEVDTLEHTHHAMSADSLQTARQIRQEIRELHDIVNAFDDITYDKGGAVIGMFERWVGPEVYRRGLQDYLKKHHSGVASMSDLLASVSAASGKDVATPFRTFLDQPGVPYVEARAVCEGNAATPKLALRQSRYVPLGSEADPNRTWQIPVCARYPKDQGTAVACTLLREREGALELPGLPGGACPAWVMPNADGAGYYRWSLAAEDRSKLAASGYAKLNVSERLSFAQSLKAGFQRGATPAAEVMAALAPLARDPSYAVAVKPMDLLRTAIHWLEGDPAVAAVEKYGRDLYAPVYRDLGWEPKKGKGKGQGPGNAPAESVDQGLLREQVIDFLALTVRDPSARKEAVKRAKAYLGFGKDAAIHPEAVDPALAGVALAVAVQEEGGPIFDAILAKLATTNDEAVRLRLLSALGRTKDPVLAARARELSLDPRVRAHEMMTTVFPQVDQTETREAGWTWFKEHLDALIGRLSPKGSGFLPWVGSSFCDRARATEVKAVFAPRIKELDGGPRNLASVTEAIELCVSQRDAQKESARAFFTKVKAKQR